MWSIHCIEQYGPLSHSFNNPNRYFRLLNFLLVSSFYFTKNLKGSFDNKTERFCHRTQDHKRHLRDSDFIISPPSDPSALGLYVAQKRICAQVFFEKVQFAFGIRSLTIQYQHQCYLKISSRLCLSGFGTESSIRNFR